MVSGLAGAPRPTGSGAQSSSATPTQTATTVAAPPSTRPARADRCIGTTNRTGSSMKRDVRTASPTEMRTVAGLPASPSGRPSSGAASKSTGQCHRRHEYEIRPGAAQPAPLAGLEGRQAPPGQLPRPGRQQE